MMSRLLTLLLAFSCAVSSSAQERLEFLLDVEGVHRNSEFGDGEPGVRFSPAFDNGGGVGGGLNYFVAPSVSIEIKLAALATRLELRERGSDYVTVVDAGYTQIYPVTAVLQWHPIDGGSVHPYLGVGVAHVIVKDLEASDGGPSAKFDNPTGLVLDGGIRVPLSKRWLAYGDVRYVPVETESSVRFDGDPPAKLDVRPLVVAFGVGYRF